MSDLFLYDIQSLTSTNGIHFRKSNSENDEILIDDFSFNVINRGSPLSTDNLVELRCLNQIHYYETSGAVLYLRTSLVQNAIYEFTYTATGGSSNIDFTFKPNGNEYTGEFLGNYYSNVNNSTSFGAKITEEGDANVQAFRTRLIYFDHYGGEIGTNPMGTFRFCTGPTNKYYQYKGSDTESLCFGYGRWTNNSRTWDWVGELNFYGDNKRVWIRRIA